jgi:hypothetical protein
MASWTTPRTGFGTTVGLGVETTYGTAVSRTNWLQVLSTTIGRNLARTPIPLLGKKGDTSRMTADTYTASDEVAVQLSTVAAYDDSTLLLLAHLLGAVGTTGSDPYTHAFSLADRTDGLTLEHIIGNGSAEVVEGVALTSGRLSISNGGLLTLDVTGIGETSTAGASAGTPTYSSGGTPIRFDDAGQFSFNSVNYDVLSVEVNIDNAQQSRRVLNSVNTLRPIGVGFRTVSMRVTLEYMNDAVYAAYLAGTESDAVITFSGAGDLACTITLQNAQIRTHSRPVSGAGVITETIELIGQTDGTDLGLAISIVNNNSSAAAN